ncbi:MAG: hypothetical protein ABL949_16500 [Fimbriimonadaceae bacterium]
MKKLDQIKRAEQDSSVLSIEGVGLLNMLEKRFESGQLTLLYNAIREFEIYVGLMSVTAAGDHAALRVFGELVLGNSLEGVSGGPNRKMLRSFEPISHEPRHIPLNIPGSGRDGLFLGIPFPQDIPCGLAVPNPLTFIFSGLQLAQVYASGWVPTASPEELRPNMEIGFEKATPASLVDPYISWIEGAINGWAARARVIEFALNMGRQVLDGHEPHNFTSILNQLGDPGRLPPTIGIHIPCIDERQVCLTELVYSARPLLQRLGGWTFPEIESAIPKEQCIQGATSITVTSPQGKPFPSQQDLAAQYTFIAINNRAAVVIAWAPQQIQLALPAGSEAGCYSVNWIHVFDPDVINQLHGIGEQCRPYFGRSPLPSLPYSVGSHYGARFSLIGEPNIDTFHGPNGATSFDAEACTAVNLSWVTSLAKCGDSATLVVVRLWRDGQLYQTALPSSGSLSVKEAESRTYKLQVQSRLNGQLCGQLVERFVTITRLHLLRAQGLSDNLCVETGIPYTLRISISCPAPPGGVVITITSDHPERVGDAHEIINEGASNIDIEMIGAQCGLAKLTISALNHQSAQFSLTIVQAPVITNISPSRFLTCDSIRFMVEGTCLGGEVSNHLAAVLEENGQQVNGMITVLEAGVRLQIDFPPLPVGMYSFSLAQCGLIGFAPLMVIVETRQPSISGFLTNPSVVGLCSPANISVQWNVQYATRIVITRDGTAIIDRVYANPCNPVNEFVIDRLPSLTRVVDYTLTAYNTDGVMAMDTAMVMPIPTTPEVGNAFMVRNTRDYLVNVFLVNGEDYGGQFLGSLPPGNTIQVTIPPCKFRAIIGIKPAAIDDYNLRFNRSLDAGDVAVARTEGSWTVTTTVMVLGLDSAMARLVRI